MVTRRRLGCLFSLLLAVLLFYYGRDLVRVYWKYYRLTDEMQQSARFAQGRSDDEIVSHLDGVVDQLDLPAEAKRFTVRRSQVPPLVAIRTQYHVVIELPFHNRSLVFRPHVEVRQ